MQLSERPGEKWLAANFKRVSKVGQVWEMPPIRKHFPLSKREMSCPGGSEVLWWRMPPFKARKGLGLLCLA